jgi:hypothetical protein
VGGNWEQGEAVDEAVGVGWMQLVKAVGRERVSWLEGAWFGAPAIILPLP